MEVIFNAKLTQAYLKQIDFSTNYFQILQLLTFSTKFRKDIDPPRLRARIILTMPSSKFNPYKTSKKNLRKIKLNGTKSARLIFVIFNAFSFQTIKRRREAYIKTIILVFRFQAKAYDARLTMFYEFCVFYFFFSSNLFYIHKIYIQTKCLYVNYPRNVHAIL